MIVSFDLETTGLDPSTCQVLEVGAVAYDPETDEVVDEFHEFVCHPEYRGSGYALAMNSETLRRCEDRGQSGEYVAERLQDWILEACGSPRPTALGFNVGKFDLQFKIDDTLLADLFHHRVIELGSYLMGPDMTPVSSKDAVQSFLGKEGMAHNALGDARDALEVFRRARAANYSIDRIVSEALRVD